MHNPPTIDDYLQIPPHPLRVTGGRRTAGGVARNSELPLVTVLTIVLNRQKTLPQTIASVLSQSYPNIEYVIVDGASTDGTLEVLKQFDDQIDWWISEPDSGIADAVNKAISHSHGEFISWMPSDDWADPNLIQFAVETLLMSGADFVFGDVTLYHGNTPEFRSQGEKDYAKFITFMAPRLSFPTMVMRRACFQQVGLLSTNYRIVNDYEWALRCHLHGGRGVYDRRLHAHYSAGGVSDQAYLPRMLEELRAVRDNGLPLTKALVVHLYYCLRYMSKCLAKKLLPGSLYQEIMRLVRRGYSMPLH
ncbi:MAG: glycosyltransferase family 2 protein [Candidatus Tectimicrobiota bacterium]